jgi:hypothetical protein
VLAGYLNLDLFKGIFSEYATVDDIENADYAKHEKLNASWQLPIGCNEDCYIDNLGFTMTHVNIWMVVIAWIFSTLLAFIIGRRKGKSGAGALAGILLGPIGVIVSLLFA